MNEEKIIIMELNHFANCCGYFHNAYLTDGISANNGYNCRHPRQEEQYTDEDIKKNVGCCYSWSCPLGFPPDAEDLVNHGMITQEEADRDYETDESDFDYIIVTDPEMIAALRKHGITGLAER